jgi:hypothetical protein
MDGLFPLSDEMDADGANQTLVPLPVQAGSPAYSPDGKRIALSGNTFATGEDIYERLRALPMCVPWAAAIAGARPALGLGLPAAEYRPEADYPLRKPQEEL